MSASRYCCIYKAENGEWFLELASEKYEKDEEGHFEQIHTTREHSFTYGPFSSCEEADKAISYFANPGSNDVDDSGRVGMPKKSPNGEPVKLPEGWKEDLLRKFIIETIIEDINQDGKLRSVLKQYKGYKRLLGS